MKTAMDQRPRMPSQQVLAISARELAEMLGISLRQAWRLNAAGKLPMPIRLGGSVRWNRQEIMDWFRAGCPGRKVWETTREAGK